MALIVCGKCGRTVSDTREICIHCGARLREEIAEPEKAIVNVGKEEEENGENNFHLLSEEKRKELVWEFQQNVPEVEKYAKRFMKANFLLICISRFLVLNIVIRIGIAFFMSYVKNPVIYSFVSPVINVPVPILFLIWLFCLLRRNRLNSKKRRLALQKKFERWLKEEKSIAYLPEFFSLNQKQVYEQTDISSIKL